MAPWSFVYLVFGALVALTWATAEATYQRRRLVAAVRTVTTSVCERL
jgi:hypothetical protein